MSIENNEDRDLSLPDIPPGHPANAGAINGMQDFVSAPTLDWGESVPVDPVSKAKAKADWEAAKERAVQADPSTLGPADRFARHQALKDQRTAAKAAAQEQAANTTAVAGLEPGAAGTTDAIKARKANAKKAKDQAREENGTQKAATAVKSPRSRRKAASKGTDSQQQGMSTVASAPAFDSIVMPQITNEAITFLSNPNATANDLFKLRPESQAFIQYHISNMQRAEAESELNMSYLDSIAPKYSPAFEKVADALLAKLDKDRRAGIKMAAPPPAKLTTAPNKLSTAPAKLGTVQVSGVSYRPKIMQTSAFQTTSVQLGTMEIEVDKRAASMPADAASRPGPPEFEQNSENTIERGIAPERENQPIKESPSTPLVDSAAARVMQPAPSSDIGRRMLRTMGLWLQGKAEGKPLPEPRPKPAKLDKQAAPTMAHDRANLVPDAVSKRFLKVDRDYYFPDKTLAFSDQGNKLAIRGAHPEVVRSLIEIAHARGWDSITVKGTDDFRRSAWMEATQAGLKVAGYKPTALDLAELASKPATNTVAKAIAKERDAATTQQSQAGAAAQAKAKAADPAPSAELAAKARAFEMEKPGFVVKKFPELAQAYGVVDAAKKFAEVNLAQDVRDEFVSLARRHVMQKILTGEHVKGPKIYAAPAKAKDTVEQLQAPAQPAVDSGNSARSKEIPRER